jgi:outer membrane protein OmpA-like peptidoglycan-associated protein
MMFLRNVILVGLVCFNVVFAQSKKRLPNPINTPSSIEYAPSITADGQTLIYQSDQYGIFINAAKKVPQINADGKSNTMLDEYETNFFGIYEVKLHPSGQWMAPKNIEPINQYAHETMTPVMGGPSISYDGNTIYFFANFGKNGFGREDIFVSERKKNGWSRPENIGSTINTDNYEGFPSISPDGKKLYFTREILGKKVNDKQCFRIMVSERARNGKWRAPFELPAPINMDCEKAPRILADGKTLVFSSIKKEGRGDFDLYKSTMLEAGGWSEPINLDFVNTKKSDLFVSISPCGDLMYYVTDGDIFTTTIPESLRPIRSATIQGFVLDSLSGAPLTAKIVVKNKETDQILSVLDNNPSDGRYTAIVPFGESYTLSVNIPEYFNKVTPLLNEQIIDCKTIPIDFKLQKIPTEKQEIVKLALNSDKNQVLIDEQRLATEKLKLEQLELEKAQQLALERKRLEDERLAAEKLKQEQLELEKAQQLALEKKRLEDERLAVEKLKQEQLELEKAKQLALEKKRLDDERLAAEKLKQEQLELEKAQHLALEKKRLEDERLAAEKLKQEQLELEKAQKLALEKKRLEDERLGAEKLRLEQLELEKAQKLALEKKRSEDERLAAEKLKQEQLELEKAQKLALEKKRLEDERLAVEKLKQEQLELEKAQKLALEKKRLEDERIAAEKLKQEQLELEKAQQLALEKKRLEDERLAQKKRWAESGLTVYLKDFDTNEPLDGKIIVFSKNSKDSTIFDVKAGILKLPLTGNDTWLIKGTAPNYTSAEQSVKIELPKDGSKNFTVELKLGKEIYKLQLSAIDLEKNTPIAQASFTILDANKKQLAIVKADSKGAGEYILPKKGKYIVLMAAPNYQNDEQIIDEVKLNTKVTFKPIEIKIKIHELKLYVYDRFTDEELFPEVKSNNKAIGAAPAFIQGAAETVFDINLTGINIEPENYKLAFVDSLILKVRQDLKAQKLNYEFEFRFYDKKTNKPIPRIDYTVVDATTKTEVQKFMNGKNLVFMSPKKNYVLTINHPAYEPIVQKINALEWIKEREFERNIFLVQKKVEVVTVENKPVAVINTKTFGEISKGKKITLENIYFDQSSPVLRTESFLQLDELVTVLKENPGLKIEVRGHTDNVGDLFENVKLSKGRCESVVDYLVKKGIASTRLSVTGRGPMEPIAPNDTEANKKKNRRVEFLVL